MEKMAADRLPLKAVKEAERRRKKELKAATKRLVADGDSEWANQIFDKGDANINMDEILEASQRIDASSRRRSGGSFDVDEDDLKAMRCAAQPKAIKTEMLPYQLQAIQWLVEHEHPQKPTSGSNEAVQLWSCGHNAPVRYTNLATNHTTSNLPPLASGGILADDMGLGKTLEMIALIVADAEKCGRGTTLIVSPLSVMSNWSGQIARHLHPENALKVHIYHGTGRGDMEAADFEAFDVVITTYQTLAADYMPRGKEVAKPKNGIRSKGLYSMKWRRVVLDEGHIIRNPQSKGAAAVYALVARSRWALTGTPIVNSLKDLYSLLRFIGVTGGLESLEVFNSVLVRPLKSGNEQGFVLLKAIMKAFTLRRRKDMGFIDLRLPELDEYIQRVEFAPSERKRYDALAVEAKGMLKDYSEGKNSRNPGTGKEFHHLLEILLRMRQCCNHWKLCKNRVSALLTQLETQHTVALNPENIKALQDMLQIQIESHEDCAICMEALHDPVITNCGHTFGRTCITQVINRQHKCPMCRAGLDDERCLTAPKNECGEDDLMQDDHDPNASSTKLDAMVNILDASKKSGNKTIVFSQWTSFLDIVQTRLEREGYRLCRLDGTMSAPKRDEALRALDNDPATTVLLASLGVCAVGLNLTAANQIVLCDTWW